MATSASSSAAILSTMKHVTTNKWDKAEARLQEIKGHVRDAEMRLVCKPGSRDADQHKLEADVASLLTAVRKAYAGAPSMSVSTRAGLRSRGAAYESLETRLNTIERMLSNAKYSSGFSTSAALSWRDELLAYLRQSQRRMEYTILFGKLTNEWANFRFGELSDTIVSAKQGGEQQSDAVSEDEEGPVSVGRKEMHEQRQVWESLVTNPRTSDKDKIVEFLDNLFHAAPLQKKSSSSVEELADLRTTLLKKMRKSIFNACKRTIHIDVATVKAAIQAILAADQLTSEKRRAMIDLSNRENVLSEIADILNFDLKLAAVERWSWGDAPIQAQLRKAINGKYRVYMDLELLDSILIQCVGQAVSVHIAAALREAWLPAVSSVWKAKEDEVRTAAIEAQIPNFTSQNASNSTRQLRNDIFKTIFFSPRLPTSMTDGSSGVGRYDDDGSDATEDQVQANLTNLRSGPPNVVNLKTDILRVCTAEMGVQKIVHGQFCLLQSDFEWFGPSLPHSTLTTIMEYFHFPKELVQFTKSFLDMQIQFQEDGSEGAVLTRKTGIPVSFQLTDGISELLLFVLDFAVNQKTGGSHLYRNHDDLWFWGQPSQCAAAWETIRQFTQIMGMKLNKEKTAFAHAIDESNPRYKPASKEELTSLPTGKVKWGFLLFDEKQWKWTANKTAIEQHMDELRFQLKTRTSVMSHVQAYNAYMKNFLPNNFGPVIVGLGDDHPVEVLEALQHAQQYLYGGGEGDGKSSGNVASHVRKMIQERFGDENIYPVPDCFLYLGVEHGGLGLANPAPAIAQFIQLPNKDLKDDHKPLPPMEMALKKLNSAVSDHYRTESKQFATRLNSKQQKKHMAGSVQIGEGRNGDGELSDLTKIAGNGVPQFMSFATYMGTTEERSGPMSQFYETLLGEPDADWSVSSKTWAVKMFDSELEELFGGHMAEEEFLSLGLYRTLAEEKVRWSG
ncbi:reverse transcriptase [Cordyceps fumosorosea ARSEF 2679]|uniref:Reverse transcriptase n=1 Tax=Cordyceps fumosorosea (strain ARSEF 2679) TaxID=1081104 RepID=A0A168BL08_CORFA|nr:reverse transcriptase [Cordyceps fumosorosea ARSEF 2679]OAA70250.1 reverse transcriptase [Cordyceps fumosorosea ARSEF 2679]